MGLSSLIELKDISNLSQTNLRPLIQLQSAANDVEHSLIVLVELRYVILKY